MGGGGGLRLDGGVFAGSGGAAGGFGWGMEGARGVWEQNWGDLGAFGVDLRFWGWVAGRGIQPRPDGRSFVCYILFVCYVTSPVCLQIVPQGHSYTL